jgi:hypothetical protein
VETPEAVEVALSRNYKHIMDLHKVLAL